MDVVHQNDAAAFRVQPPHGAFHDRSRTAAAPPIVRVDVRAPGDQLFALQEPFNRIGAAEVRNEKNESALASPSAAVTELMPPSTSRSTRRIDRCSKAWMVLTVSADGVAFVVDVPDDGRIGTRHLADQEIGGLHALRCQRIENDVGIGRQRAVVEGDHHLVVLQRQRLLVLDGAKQGEFAGIDGQHAAGAEGVWIAGARLCGGSDGHMGHNADKQCNNEAPHSFIPHLLNASLYRNPNEIYEVKANEQIQS